MATEQMVEQDNEALIQEMMRDAQKEELHSEVFKDPVLHRGDADMPAPMVLRELKSAGYVRLWDRKTGEEVRVLYYMMPQKLRVKNPDGSPRFTAKKPDSKPRTGKIKCFLHTDDPNRKHYDEAGFAVCRKSNIPNEFLRVEHMRKRHKQEWAAIEEERKQKERQAEQELQHTVLKSLAKERQATNRKAKQVKPEPA